MTGRASPRLRAALRSAACALAFLLPGAAPAATYNLPAGCEAYLTVQSRSCRVSHHFTCAADPEGVQRRVDLTEDGLVYAGAIDAETQWLESFHVVAGYGERLEPDPADRASMTELMATGRDTYDFRTLSPEIGGTRYAGQDSLTGEVVLIDGVPLHRTRFQITATTAAGSFLWSSEGSEYISETFRMFLSGTGTVTTPEDTWEVDDTPVEFIFPGEPGFLSSRPDHGCGLLMSRYDGGP